MDNVLSCISFTARERCRPELHLPFNNGEVKDQSGYGTTVLNDGVKVINGLAYFNGHSAIRVAKIFDHDFNNFFLIRLKYRHVHSTILTDVQKRSNDIKFQTLIANGNCLTPSSLYLITSPNANSIRFGVRNTANKETSLTLPLIDVSGCFVIVVYISK